MKNFMLKNTRSEFDSLVAVWATGIFVLKFQESGVLYGMLWGGAILFLGGGVKIAYEKWVRPDV